MLTLGIDSGSTTTKGALFDGTQVVRTAILPTSANPRESILALYHQLHSPEVTFTVSTGYGRDLLEEADQKVTEITCHARGAAYLNPATRVVVDIGGQDSKVILLDNGLNVVDFLMNDKCAAGTGRFIGRPCFHRRVCGGQTPGQHLQHVHRLRRERDCQPAGHRS